MSRRVAVAAAILLGLAAAAIVGPFVWPRDPLAIDLPAALAGPSWEHPLGQDRLGRDLGARLLHGARLSLVVGSASLVLSLVIGTTVGLVAGFRGGWIDELASRTIDVLLAFPGLLLAIALAAVLGPSPRNVVLALTATGWTGYARLVRAEVMSLRTAPHVEAARSLGAKTSRILILHVLPLLAGRLIVQATFGLAGAITGEAGLSFLGLGASPPTPSWGAMINDGRGFLLTAPHVLALPALALMLAVLSIHLLGEALRDRFDVRS